MPLSNAPVPPHGDGGERIFSRAVTVAAIEIHVDPETRDRIFTIHADNEPTIELRVAPMDLAAILTRLAIAIARSLH